VIAAPKSDCGNRLEVLAEDDKGVGAVIPIQHGKEVAEGRDRSV